MCKKLKHQGNITKPNQTTGGEDRELDAAADTGIQSESKLCCRTPTGIPSVDNGYLLNKAGDQLAQITQHTTDATTGGIRTESPEKAVVCFMVSYECCDIKNITVLSWCFSPHLVMLNITCLFNRPWEISSVIISGVCIPPQADKVKAV